MKNHYIIAPTAHPISRSGSVLLVASTRTGQYWIRNWDHSTPVQLAQHGTYLITGAVEVLQLLLAWAGWAVLSMGLGSFLCHFVARLVFPCLLCGGYTYLSGCSFFGGARCLLFFGCRCGWYVYVYEEMVEDGRMYCIIVL